MLSRRALLGGAGALVGLAARPTRTAGAPTAAGAAAEVRTDPGAGGAGWAASWATAPVAPTGADPVASVGFTDTTVRQVLRLSAGGQVPLRFGNPFGADPVLIGPVSVALGTGGAHIDTGTSAAVTFGGSPTGLLAAGAPRSSATRWSGRRRAVPDRGRRTTAATWWSASTSRDRPVR
ncbi:hypothetical protein [Occultella kanbiaonis]|uniref:hypothetical protein n=1 Tax=Occultella kanbiaonis TaxID=2675754 RepID=UPI0013D5004B|nr:hypothetical protein [Occultella kanbiaonis]